MSAPESSYGDSDVRTARRMVWPAASPRWAVPMPQGTWAYSTGDDLDQCPRGVYRESGDDTWMWMAPLPYVLSRLIRRTSSGQREATLYRMALSADAASSDVVICDEEEIKTGVWASKLDVALTPSRQIIDGAAAAIVDTAREHAEVRELAPRLSDHGEPELPPSDVGPAGYGDTAEDSDAACVAWNEILTIAARSPRLALTLGAAFGGLYIRPLGRLSFFWLMCGDAGLGKTTGVELSAALFGHPDQIAQSWYGTSVNVIQELGLLGFLPAFRDDLGAGGFRSQELEKLVLAIANGGNRGTGSKTHLPRRSAPWHGALISSGNSNILGEVQNEGVARRVIELPTPITHNAADAERLTGDKTGWHGLHKEGYGWPLRWLLDAGFDVPGFAARVSSVEHDFPLPDDAVPRSLARHLAVAVAGIDLLASLIGTDLNLRDTAMTEARQILDQQVAEIREHGITPGERVLSVAREARAARPAAYPTRKKYTEERDSEFPPTREIEGWNLTPDKHPGDLAVLTGKFEELCHQRGVNNVRLGLRELERDGLLIRSNERDGRLRRRLRLGAEQHGVYVFALNDDDDESPGEDDTGDTDPGNAASPQDHNTATTANTESQPQQSDTKDNAEQPTVIGPDGPVYYVPGQQDRPCRLCDAGSPPFIDEVGAIHPVCAKTPEKPAEAATDAPSATVEKNNTTGEAPAAARRSQPRRGERQLATCGVLDEAGLWLPEADTPVTVQPPVDIAAAYRLALSNDLRQLWIHPNVHEQLGIPATREITADVGPATAVAHEWTDVADMTVDAAGAAGLAAWVNVQPADESDRRIAIVFPAYDHTRTAWHTASDGRTLRDAVLRFTAVTGWSYYMSPNETSAAMILRSSSGKSVASYDRKASLPHPIAKVHHLTDDSRALTDDEDSHEWAHAYDLNAAQAAVNSGVFVGVGEPERVTVSEFQRKQWAKLAGYMLANVPRNHAALDPRLPDIIQPWARADERSDEPGGPTWVPIETLVLLDELGVPIEVSEALYWPTSRRLLRSYGETMSKARLDLLDGDDEPSALAVSVLKGMYKSRIGDFNRPGSRIYRPDWRDMILAKAVANGYRKLRKIGSTSGRYPIAWHVDAALYTSDDPDPTNAAPSAMQFGPAMGEWKPEPAKTLPLVKVREHLGERGFEAKLDRIRNGRK